MTAPPPGTLHDDVLVGHDGWLFLARGKHDVLDFVTGQRQVPTESFTTFNRMIAARAARVAALGAGYRHLIFPDKQSVLAEAFPLPDPIRLGELYLARCRAAAAHVLYPLAALRQAPEPGYQRTDSHASDAGYRLVATAVAAALTGGDAADYHRLLAEGPMQEKLVSGDLGRRFDPPLAAAERVLRTGWPLARLSNGVTGANNGIVDLYFSRHAVHPARLLLFGDSFGRSLARLLSRFFQEVAFLRTPFLHAEILAQMRPDFVLTQNIERYLSRVHADAEAPSFLLYPHLGRHAAPHAPSRAFAEAFSALLSAGRPPYQAFRLKLEAKRWKLGEAEAEAEA
jgi:hypothetical protein